MRRFVGLGLILIQAGCLQADLYACSDDSQCVRPGRIGGECFSNWCTYEDESCASERRFSDNAGRGLAGTCVPDDDDDGTGEESDDPTNVTVSASQTGADTSEGSTGEDECTADCSVTPGPCFASQGCENGTCAFALLPEGTDCEIDNPCVVAASCDAKGGCVPDATLDCLDPPTSCYEDVGTCNLSTGFCEYDTLPVAAQCSDAQACTIGDRCDGNGSCIPGDECPQVSPCRVGVCIVNDECEYSNVTDNTPCGMGRSGVCCDGDCLDVPMCM